MDKGFDTLALCLIEDIRGNNVALTILILQKFYSLILEVIINSISMHESELVRCVGLSPCQCTAVGRWRCVDSHFHTV